MPQISNYWALCLLILIAFAFYINKKSLAELSSFRKWIAFAIRALLILIFTLSIAGLKIVWKSNKICVIFALDVSNSISEDEKQRGLSFIGKSLEKLKDDDQAGLVVFGEKADIDIPPKTVPQINRVSSIPSKNYTNINSAIKTAVDLFPQGFQKKIVLISDGNENIGNVLNEADGLKSQDIEIHSIPLSTRLEGKNEVLIENLIAPSQASMGQLFDIRAVIKSNTDALLKVMLFMDGKFVDQQEVTIKKPDSKKMLIFRQIIMDGERSHTYKASIEPNIDTIRENNQAQVLVASAGKQKVLYVDGNAGIDYLKQALENNGLSVTAIKDMSMFPSSIIELRDYSAIIFDNISAYAMSESQMKMIETYVHDAGGGFLMIGGENSFGSGGYHNTLIEKILPVKMIPEQKKRSVSIMLLIDRSGSMNALSGNISKIELAKSASVSVIGLLTEKDKIGVIAFDAKADEIVKLDKIQEDRKSEIISKKQIIDSISGMKARGGTNIYPALRMAYDNLKNSDSQIKHIIILSDGRSLQMDESFGLVKQIALDSITISSVVISDEADKKFMQDIANAGSGRYYETKDAGNLPRLFIKETFMASKLITEGDIQPIVSDNSEILKGVSSLPGLRGYIGTSAKEGASVILKSTNGDPILSTWQYGLGRSVAFTSDSQPKWALEWLKWADFGKFWHQAIKWCMSEVSGEFDATTTITGSKGLISVDAVSASGQLRNFLNFSASIIKPDLTSETIELKQSASGRYDAEFDADQMGVYLLSITEMSDGKPISTKTLGLTVSYSPEYIDLVSNRGLLENLALATGGKFKPEISDIVDRKSKSVKHIQDIRRWLLIISIPLFFLDVAIRRITISKGQLQEFMRKLLVFNRPPEQAEENTTFAYLKSRKERMIEIKTIDKIEIRAELPSKMAKATPEKTGSYASRLLEAKRRAEKSTTNE
jgi:uncharacterized membrane protein